MIHLLKYINIFSGLMSLYSYVIKKANKKEGKVTRTDKFIDAMEKAVSIRREMEICGLMILSMIDEDERESIDDVFKKLGQPEVDFKQMVEFVKDARFKWDKYTDCLLILYGMQMPKEIKDDVIKHSDRKRSERKPSERKIRKIREKLEKENEESEVVNQAGLDALEKLAKDLERVKELKAQQTLSNKEKKKLAKEKEKKDA